MKIQNFIIWIHTASLFRQKQFFYEDIAEDVKTRFETSNYEIDGPLPKGKNKKVTELLKEELGRKTMKKFVGLRAKTYSYIVDDGSKEVEKL